MLTILWYTFLIVRLNALNFLSFSSFLSLFIFFAISGRIPFPLKQALIEPWMFLGLIFIILNLFFIDPGLRYIKSYINGKIDFAIFTYIFLVISIIFSTISLIYLDSYKVGYYPLFLIMMSLSFILAFLCKSNNREKIRNTIFSSIVSSTLLVTLIGYFAQILIFFGFYNCEMLSIYHPESDIHCIPFLGTQIYRFSIGSNINEFSMYLLISFVIISNQPKIVEGMLPFKKINFIQKNTFSFIRVFLLLAILLSLSRAAILGLLIFFIIKSANYIFNLIYFSKIKINKKYFFRDFKLIFFIFFVSLFLVAINSELSSRIQYLLTSRFSFVFNFTDIFEGSSSQHRLLKIKDFQQLIQNFSIIPSIPLGSGTGLHNSFLQFMLEFGLLPAMLGLFLLLKQIIQKTSYVAPLIIVLSAHHVIYNPIVWIYLSSIAMLEKKILINNSKNF